MIWLQRLYIIDCAYKICVQDITVICPPSYKRSILLFLSYCIIGIYSVSFLFSPAALSNPWSRLSTITTYVKCNVLVLNMPRLFCIPIAAWDPSSLYVRFYKRIVSPSVISVKCRIGYSTPMKSSMLKSIPTHKM